MQRAPSLFISSSDLDRRGVFTAEPIAADSLLEICPVIVLPEEDLPHIDETELHDYYFMWGEDEKKCGIVLGYGSLYNHSFSPNAEYRANYQNGTLNFYALRDIAAGEEITVNYNGDPGDDSPLWFRVLRE